MSDTNRSKLAFNLTKFKSAARRESRKHSWSIPFLNKPKRASTTTDLERGTTDGLAPARQVTSAPESSRRYEDGTFNSQDESTGSPTLNGSADEPGVRKRFGKTPSERDAARATREQEKEKKKKEEKVHFGFIRHVEPKEPYTFANQFRATILNSWVNIFLLAIPAGFACFYGGIDGKIVFAVNFVAIIPLAALLSYGTEEVALRTGETIGGLINATFGNAVELIVGIEALLNDEITVVKTSLIGSILSNLLLVLGMCFFFGGFGRQVQYFNKTVAQTSASLLALAIASNIIPTVFAEHANVDNTITSIELSNIASLSRGTSVILLIVYIAYLVFQLKTHIEVFNEPSQKVERTHFRKKHSKEGINAMIQAGTAVGASPSGPLKDEHDQQALADLHRHEDSDDEDEEEEEKATLSGWVALLTLFVSTILVAFCAEFMVEGISSITSAGVSVEFVGLILLPIVGNAAEHVTAVTVAIKDKMDLAIGVAVGSSMQVSLFLIPFIVIVGWGKGVDDMNLAFDTFQVAVVFVTVLLVNYLIADGESHWLEGFLLICLYFIIAVCSWWYPADGSAV
ncbi:putative Sodium/calcium exchanger membrane region domain-containing protein [Seiridium unicorne]|uniref:Sodium/calcium exchanger membrane region domain-containing protein n=1 Tax=Seiridium unicorne TaxID=138068 RepID=A0ABR2VF57_9PEZI